MHCRFNVETMFEMKISTLLAENLSPLGPTILRKNVALTKFNTHSAIHVSVHKASKGLVIFLECGLG